MFKWYKWTYIQIRNRPTDMENKHGLPKGREGEREIESLGLTYTHYNI